MADVVILFACALVVLAGGITAVVILRAGARRRQLAEQDRPRRLREQRARLDDYIRRVNQATADEELDSLENERKHF